jgi:tripartite-type tricarboxylate transporter receptor subunit TctC
VRVSRSLLFTVIGVLLFGSPSKAQDEPFYKGKTLRVIAGTTAGALYDQWARIIAAHIVKHIPGNPQVFVQNMPGAGHQIAANYLYNVAKPDGLTVIGSIIPTLYLDQLVGRAEVKFDWGKFLFVGSPVKGDSQLMMRADVPPSKLSKICATPRSRPNAAAPARAARILYFLACSRRLFRR